MSSAANPWETVLPGQPGATRFSTDELPERERVAIFREVVAKTVVRNEVDPLSDDPFYVHSTVRALPGLFAYWSRCSPNRLTRGPEFLSDGNDNLIFSWSDQPRLVEHLGREVPLSGGEAILVSCSDAVRKTMPFHLTTVTISLPRKVFAPLLRDFDGCVARPVPAGSAALALLRRYLDILRDESSTPTPALRNLAVSHVYDLAAVVVGATRDAAETAKQRGVGAALLCAIKDTIRENLGDSTLSESMVAARHRISPRYLQMLFRAEETTFTEFLLAQRLVRARTMLVAPHLAHRKIVDVALACGFADISYFNRKFRACYGATPSDIRNSGYTR